MDQPQPVNNGEFFTFDWDLTTAANGPVILRATLTDGEGRTTSETRSVIVDNGDRSIMIGLPAVGQVIGARFVFAADISDPSGIQSFEMYVGNERVDENRNIPAGITQLPIPADVDVDERVRTATNW